MISWAFSAACTSMYRSIAEMPLSRSAAWAALPVTTPFTLCFWKLPTMFA